MRRSENKYRFTEIRSIPEFIGQYISGVELPFMGEDDGRGAGKGGNPEETGCGANGFDVPSYFGGPLV